MNERLLKGEVQSEDANIDAALRPTNLSEFIGQQRVKDQLQLVLHAAAGRGVSADHVLLAGPPGLGKTTLAMIIAAEMDAPLRVTSGPTIQHAGDLASILSSLLPGEVLFIDEIHRVARAAQELLYLAMEDFRVDVMVGKGAGATSISLDLDPFTLIGATTRSGLLPNPLRDRFGFTANLDFYATEELEQVVARAAKLMKLEVDSVSIGHIASRSRGTPRIANRLLRRVRDFALVHHDGKVLERTVSEALELYEVDPLGLDRLDRAVLTTLIQKFEGRPVGLSTLSVAIGEDQETIESVVEPFLLRTGLIARTTRGRVATAAGYRHLGLTPPNGEPDLFD